MKELRSRAMEAALEAIPVAMQYGNEPDYHVLYCFPDGTLSWEKQRSRTEQLYRQDNPIEYVMVVGRESAYVEPPLPELPGNLNEVVDKAVARLVKDQIIAEFQRIPVGYFDDEEWE